MSPEYHEAQLHISNEEHTSKHCSLLEAFKAKSLNFIEAASLRDQLKEIKEMIKKRA